MVHIETPRLLLRNFRPEDWRDLQRLAQGFMASPMRVYDNQWALDDASIQETCQFFAATDHFMAVTLGQAGTFLGFVCLNPDQSGSSYDMGYNFLAEGQGAGYATEACRAVLRYAFDTLGTPRITAGTAEANLPSQRLLARLGFEKTGESQVSFTQDAAGMPIVFTGYSFDLPRAQYDKKEEGP